MVERKKGKKKNEYPVLYYGKNVDLIENTANGLSEPNFPPGESDHNDGIIDAKLVKIIQLHKKEEVKIFM